MKKIYTIVAALLMTASVFAQAPEKMSYQAVVRDASNQLTTNQAVGMQISILQTTATGTAVYTETQTPTTNANGLVSLEIGSGTVVSGTFNTIDWSAGPYFIKTETDPTGGTTYTITGTTQLMSVPYALHAKTAESVTGSLNETDPVFGASIANGITAADTANWNNHTVDTDTQLDSTDIATMGFITLIVNKTESTAVWQATATLTNADRTEDGAYNTVLMISSAAASYVNGLTDGSFTDWYLPSIDELSSLWHSRLTTNKALRAGGFTLLSTTASYWSSTEYNTTLAFYFYFFNGDAQYDSKSSTYSVRAVRAF